MIQKPSETLFLRAFGNDVNGLLGLGAIDLFRLLTLLVNLGGFMKRAFVESSVKSKTI
jgi:hypothetical protein